MDSKGVVKAAKFLGDSNIQMLKLVFDKEERAIEVLTPESLKLTFFKKNPLQMQYNRFFKIVGSKKEELLDCGDILFLGKREYMVREMANAKNIVKYTVFAPNDVDESIVDDSWAAYQINYDNVRTSTCCVCGMDELGVYQKGELLTMCDCFGRDTYHLNCLYSIVKQNSEINKTDYCLHFSVKNLSCRHCSKPYARNFQIGSEKKQLINLEKLGTQYILFEEVGDHDNSVFKGFAAIFQEPETSITIVRLL